MEDFKSLVKVILPQGRPHLQSVPSIPLVGHEPVYPPGVDGRTLSSAWRASPGLASDGADGEKALSQEENMHNRAEPSKEMGN